MGKRLVMRNADFSTNAIIRTIEYELVNNSFTWGKGGITSPGSTSGSTNSVIGMAGGLPLQQNSGTKELVLVAANGYKIRGYLSSDLPSPSSLPSHHEYVYTEYSPQLEQITIPPGKYFQISMLKQDGTTASTADGASALKIRQEVIPD